MSVIDKILEEIDKTMECGLIDYINGEPVITKKKAKDIIRKHMDGAEYPYIIGKDNDMMDDLISRKAVIEKLEEWCGSQRYLISEEMREIIKTMPVAFDREKVMAKLRSEYMDASNMYSRLRGTAHSYSSEVRKDAWEKAVEIVEKGGIE